ncbi:MAG: winged helix DNA-binding domain-containing protein [Actinomycetia bacterium]|nr:winged helix DNA-binding domain-containing protein [Actinomycetes bacterium]
MRTFSVDERRARLGLRHGLIGGFSSVDEAVRAVVVLHATDPASVFLSAMARLAEPSIEIVGRALYGERSVVRVLAMRRTLFVCPVSFLEVVERSSSDDVAARERPRLEKAMVDSGFDDPAGWMATAADEIVGVLAGRGVGARTLTAEVPMLATKIRLGAGTKWETEVGATSRMLGQLAMEGILIRGRPSGDWTGRQYAWHLRSDWLGQSSSGSEGEGRDSMTKEEASVELVRCWLARFGPGTFDDLKWWTGWRVSQLRPALAELDVVEVDLDGEVGLVLADDLDPTTPVEPWAALLPSLDPTPMGWKDRRWYLGPHQPELFDRNGNIGPTVWVDGRIVGGWAQRPDGEVVTKLLEDVDADRAALIGAKVERLQHLLADTVVKPSFRTPLLRTLSE